MDGARPPRAKIVETDGGEITIQRRDGRIHDSDTVAPGRDAFCPVIGRSLRRGTT
jgi:hypothetical protein